ncbi:MAG: hypothetical protein EA397_13570 [Deltaproteobacteria bacterium]|nr:MAG: hypothetical protein EA397_13570 [Deltaproteobacteria bacterium]
MPTLLGYAALGLALWLIDGGNLVEATILEIHHRPLARWMLWGEPREILTYPPWGYALLLTLVQDHPAVLVIGQVVAAALSWWGLHRWTAPRFTLPEGIVRAVFGLGAVPWIALAVTAQPAFWTALAILAALLSLDRAVSRSPPHRGGWRRLWWWGGAGALFAIAAHLRTESLVLLLVALIAGAWPLASLRRRGAGLLLAGGVAILLILPWHLTMRVGTGTWHASPSNGGMVAYLSLGQLPNNPWSLVANDETARYEAQARTGQPPYSPTGNAALWRATSERILDHPPAFVAKVIFNAASAAVGGLYVGTANPVWISQDAHREGRASLKRSIADRDPTVLRTHPWQVTGLAYEVIGRLVLGTPLLLLAWFGAWSALRGRAFAFARWSAVLLVAQVLLIGLFQYQPRHMNLLLPAIVVLALHGIQRWSERRSLALAEGEATST